MYLHLVNAFAISAGIALQSFVLRPRPHDFNRNPPHRPDSKRHRWLPDSMEESLPARTKALYPIFADRRTRTGSVLKQIAGEGFT